MRLFRGRTKRKSDQENEERMLDGSTEAAPAAPTAVPNARSEAGPDTAPSDTPEPDAKEAGTAADAPEEAPPPQDNLLAQIGAEADAELAKEEAAAADAPEEAPPPQDNLLAQIGAEADAELAKEEAAAAEGGSPTDKDELDPELLDIFRDARNEVQESSLAAELEDIAVQQLLDDLASVSRRLGVPPRGLTTDLDTDMGESSNESPDVSQPDDD
jgi:hypothetical protein